MYPYRVIAYIFVSLFLNINFALAAADNSKSMCKTVFVNLSAKKIIDDPVWRGYLKDTLSALDIKGRNSDAVLEATILTSKGLPFTAVMVGSRPNVEVLNVDAAREFLSHSLHKGIKKIKHTPRVLGIKTTILKKVKRYLARDLNDFEKRFIWLNYLMIMPESKGTYAGMRQVVGVEMFNKIIKDELDSIPKFLSTRLLREFSPKESQIVYDAILPQINKMYMATLGSKEGSAKL